MNSLFQRLRTKGLVATIALALAGLTPLLTGCGGSMTFNPPQGQSLNGLAFGTDSTFEVITWNVEKFPKSDETPLWVAGIIHSVDPDVVLLQEVQHSFDRLLDDLNELDARHTWKGHKASSASFAVDLACVYKSDVVHVDEIYEILFDDRRPLPRRPLVVELTYDSASFVLINNHFKAGGNRTIDWRNEWDEERRRYDASTLLEQYISHYFPDENVIIVGDLNDDIAEPPEKNVFLPFLERPEEYLFVDMDIAKGNSSGWSWQGWVSSYGACQLDHVVISNELFDNVLKVATLLVDEYVGGWRIYHDKVSDHRPVALQLTIQRPPK